MAYLRGASPLSWRDKLYMARKRFLKLGARFLPYLHLRLYCLRKAGVVLGSQVYVGEDLIITEILEDRRTHLILGNRVAIGQRVTIITASDPNYSCLGECFNPINGMVKVEDDAWIGAGAIIMPNVTVGKAAAVGAGSVVTRDVPPYTVVAGSPARVIRTIHNEVSPAFPVTS